MCIFCGARRFEYEPFGFGCSKGAIKLIFHEISVELKKAFILKIPKEAKYFQTYVRTYNNIFVFTSLGVNYVKELS